MDGSNTLVLSNNGFWDRMGQVLILSLLHVNIPATSNFSYQYDVPGRSIKTRCAQANPLKVVGNSSQHTTDR